VPGEYEIVGFYQQILCFCAFIFNGKEKQISRDGKRQEEAKQEPEFLHLTIYVLARVFECCKKTRGEFFSIKSNNKQLWSEHKKAFKKQQKKNKRLC
jgi:hypothetical protein